MSKQEISTGVEKLSFSKKMQLRMNNFYWKLSSLIIGTSISSAYIFIHNSNTRELTAIATAFGIGLLIKTKNGRETMEEYVRVRSIFDKEGDVDERLMRKYASKNTFYCVRRGCELAILEISKKRPEILERWKEICLDNGLKPLHSLHHPDFNKK